MFLMAERSVGAITPNSFTNSGSLIQMFEIFSGMMILPDSFTVMLFLGMVDDATTFAETRGGGGGGSDLKWGRDEDEDNRAWARCV